MLPQNHNYLINCFTFSQEYLRKLKNLDKAYLIIFSFLISILVIFMNIVFLLFKKTICIYFNINFKCKGKNKCRKQAKTKTRKHQLNVN